MNREKKVGSEAEHARIESEIGHILATEEELMPSSGFVTSVMECVRHEAALPAPLPFPWIKAIVLILLVSGVVSWGVVELVRLGMPGFGLNGLNQFGQSWLTIFPQHLSADLMRSLELAGWVALALGSSLLSWLISRRLAGRGGLL
ncbi:MAG: hypothetical protein ABR990_07360 [Terracidiphilus sp.]|jgi:hypothetical protein